MLLLLLQFSRGARRLAARGRRGRQRVLRLGLVQGLRVAPRQRGEPAQEAHDAMLVFSLKVAVGRIYFHSMMGPQVFCWRKAHAM